MRLLRRTSSRFKTRRSVDVMIQGEPSLARHQHVFLQVNSPWVGACSGLTSSPARRHVHRYPQPMTVHDQRTAPDARDERKSDMSRNVPFVTSLVLTAMLVLGA